ncbi:MAG: hypothetical protein ACLUJG_06315 [Lawsonibacter sp.]
MKVGIAGLGLIGGSLAKAYEKSGAAVYGYDGNRVVQDYARAPGHPDRRSGSGKRSETATCFWWHCIPKSPSTI